MAFSIADLERRHLSTSWARFDVLRGARLRALAGQALEHAVELPTARFLAGYCDENAHVRIEFGGVPLLTSRVSADLLHSERNRRKTALKLRHADIANRVT